MRALPNLRSTATFECVPWEWCPEKPVDDLLRTDKKLRTTWITDTFTKHCVYSGVEGLNENERVTKPKAGSEGNPPHLIHAYVADYDKFKLTREMVETLARGTTTPPNWYEVTLSGWARFVWVFEAPVRVSGWKMAKEFFKKLTSVVGADTVLPGFDPSSEEPQQYWTNSCEWVKISDTPLSHALLTGLLVDLVSATSQLNGPLGVKVPIEDAAVALRDKYAGFIDWPGEFTVGSQGPTFWIPESTSPKSAVVKEDGIYTFSGHAPQAFYSWADLLGKNWVDRYEGESIGKLVSNIFYDTKTAKFYFPVDEDKNWIPLSAHDLGQQLVVKRGADSRADKSGTSVIVRAVCHIQTEQGVRGCAPFVFLPPGLVSIGPSKDRFLNSARNTPVDPDNSPQVWGPNGNFPFISAIIDALFARPEAENQRDHFMSELAYFYKWAWKRAPRPGHLLILAGGTGVGKSFLTNIIIGNLMGGCVDAAKLLLGEDGFTSPYLHFGVWTADDIAMSDSQTARNQMSMVMKRVVANTVFMSNEKYGSQVRVEWNGRVFMTTNMDEESIRHIPEITSSNQDKFCIYRLSDTVIPGLFSADRDANAARVKGELRAFARYLLDWRIPEQLAPPNEIRFGLRSYLNPFVLNRARANADSAFLTELIDDWRREYFNSGEGLRLEKWQGTTTQLLRMLAAREIGTGSLVRVTPHQAAAHLRRMSSMGGDGVQPIVSVSTLDPVHNIRQWHIHRPTDLPLEVKKPISEVNSAASKNRFQKT